MKIQTENKNYVRDMHSKALLATNRGKAEDYRFKSGLVRENRELKERVQDMENELAEIKRLLKK